MRFGGRDYDSDIGAWIAKDPAGFGGGGSNLYQYSGQDPINYVDPDGRVVVPAIILLLWGIYEVGSSAYDMLNAVQVALDPCASPGAKLSTAGLAAIGFALPGGGYSAVGRGSGQLHHVISTKVHRALDVHPTLATVYAKRDPRFVVRAVDREAHIGYQKWHRALDKEVADYLRSNPNLTSRQFEQYLRGRYAQSDLQWRFPGGF